MVDNAEGAYVCVVAPGISTKGFVAVLLCHWYTMVAPPRSAVGAWSLFKVVGTAPEQMV